MAPSAFRVLAFDTSAQTTSLALCDVGRQGVMIEQHLPADNKHAETLLPSLKAMLAEAGSTLAEVDLIAVGVGPGSFTGVRVGVATAKGLGLALQKPVIPVVSLDALAYEAHEAHERTQSPLIAACLDAFKGELFCALYAARAGELCCERAPFHAVPTEVRAALAAASGEQRLLLVGGGVGRYPELMADAPASWRRDDAIVSPRARIVAQLAAQRFARGEIPELARVTPVYVRDSDAQLPKVPLRV